jgi:probable HAF family extracellular repeat protein
VYNVATSINNQGDVVGWACVGSDTNPLTCIEHGFLWTRETGMQDLGIFPGAIANGPPCCNTINNEGEIVGTAIGPNFEDFPFNERALVRRGNTWVDLNTLIPVDSGWYPVCGQGVNDAGEITGFGIVNGIMHHTD